MLDRLLQFRRDRPVALRSRPLSIVQPDVDTFTEWKLSAARAAVAAHEDGDFSESGLLIEAMRRDDRISACLRNRGHAILSRNGDFRIDTAEGGSNDVTDQVERWWPRVVPDSVLFTTVIDMVMAGFSIWRILWERTDRSWQPVGLERWYTSNIRFDRERQVFMARTKTQEVEVVPGDPNWLVFAPGGGRTWMAGSVRALGLAFIMRQFNWRDWARFNERHGLPIIAIKEPAGQYAEGIKKGFYAGVKRMGSTGILRLPQANDNEGFELDIIEAKDRAYETFGEFYHALNNSIAIHLLGQNLMTEAEGGSYALGTVQNLIRLDIRGADVDALSNALREQLINFWGFYNIPGWDPEVAPWPFWDTAEPVDRKEESTTLKQTAEAIISLAKTKLPVDWEAVCERMGLPLIEGAPLPDPPDPNEPDPEPEPDTGDDGEQATEGAGDAPASAKYPRAGPHNSPGGAGRIRLASGAVVDDSDGFVEGQDYADRLVDETTQKASAALSSIRARLLELVDEAEDYETLQQAVVREFRDFTMPDELAEIMRKATILAEFAGEAAARQEHGG